MNTNTRLRVLIHCRGAGAEIFRTLVSLACQTIGPQRLNIVLASTAPEEHASPEANLLHSALGFQSITIIDAARLHPIQALNIAALEGEEQWLALVPAGARLAPRFMARCLDSALEAKIHAVYPAHTAGSPGGVPLTRVRPFNAEQLVRTNPVGPAALVRREAWQRLGGLRPGAQLPHWDFWLRLALAGGDIKRVPELLLFSRPMDRLAPWQDGQAKALLVIGLPGAFEPDVCRWALALLRGDPWAKPFEQGQIPGAREVRAMFAGLSMPLRPDHAAWSAPRVGTA